MAQAQHVADLVAQDGADIAVADAIDVHHHDAAAGRQGLGDGQRVARQLAAGRCAAAQGRDGPDAAERRARACLHRHGIARRPNDLKVDQAVQRMVPFVHGAEDLGALADLEAGTQADRQDLGLLGQGIMPGISPGRCRAGSRPLRVEARAIGADVVGRASS